MADPVGDVAARQPVLGEEGVEVGAQVAPDHQGNVGGEHDMEAPLVDLPAHDVFGVRVEDGAGRDHPRPGRFGDPRMVIAQHDDGGRAIAEQAGGDQVRDRQVAALHGQEHSSTESSRAACSGKART